MDAREDRGRETVARRAFLRGAACCACCGGGFTLIAAPAAPVSAQQSSAYKAPKGCIVPPEDTPRVLGSRTAKGNITMLPDEVRTMMRSTGNQTLDVTFDQALQRLAQTFGVWPKVGFYDDGAEPNALAMSYPEGGKTTYTVLFGRNYFLELYKYDPSGITILQTAAHEFGHVWMFQSGELSQLISGQPTVKRAELHADFLAGYYLGLRKRDNPTASLWNAGMRRWQSGDNQFRSKHHHGTPAERLAAAEAGFKMGFLDAAPAKDAFLAASRFVTAA